MQKKKNKQKQKNNSAETCRWEKLKIKGEIPEGREGHTTTNVEHDGKNTLLIFGGHSGNDWLNDCYVLDLKEYSPKANDSSKGAVSGNSSEEPEKMAASAENLQELQQSREKIHALRLEIELLKEQIEKEKEENQMLKTIHKLTSPERQVQENIKRTFPSLLFEDFALDHQLGSGRVGEVFKSGWKKTFVAVKVCFAAPPL